MTTFYYLEDDGGPIGYAFANLETLDEALSAAQTHSTRTSDVIRVWDGVSHALVALALGGVVCRPVEEVTK